MKTQKEAADQFGVSVSSLQRARRVILKGSAGLRRAVEKDDFGRRAMQAAKSWLVAQIQRS